MRRIVSLAAVVLLVVVGVSACGDSGPSAQEKREAAKRKQLAEERKEKQAAVAEAQTCRSQLGGLLEALEELEGRLQIGLNYDDYFEEVGGLQVAYNRIPINQLSEGCLTQVGVPSEGAFNAHTEAATAWDECFEDLTCEEEDPTLQAKWDKAGRQFARAQRGLTAMANP